MRDCVNHMPHRVLAPGYIAVDVSDLEIPLSVKSVQPNSSHPSDFSPLGFGLVLFHEPFIVTMNKI